MLFNALVALIIVFLLVLNVRLYQPGRIDTTITQLHFIGHSLDEGGAERMQQLFPEGYLFTWALYGLASANMARALAPTDPRRAEALSAAREAVKHVDSETARATFNADMTPRYGAFYASWSLYVRSAVLRASGPHDPVPFNLAQFQADCDTFVLALALNDSPFLESYPAAVWPVDTTVGIAALAIADPFLQHRHQASIATWLERARQRGDLATGALPHRATEQGMPAGGARGGSLAMMSFVLAEVDPAFARRQYQALRQHFVDYHAGVVAVREYPHGGDGPGDIDSGPLLFGFSASASVLGVGAAIANGDAALADTLLSTIEFAGMALQTGDGRKYAGGLLPVGDAFLAWARSAPPVTGAPYAAIVPHWWRVPIHAASLLLAGILAWMALWMRRRSARKHTGV
jgi:hypothetical protein